MAKNIILFILLNTLCFINTSAQETHFQSLTVKDGLSQHDVSSIIQDKFGFIWIGTYNGLNRFDGNKVVNFLHDPKNRNTISSNRILSLLEDSNKRIWIGTDGNGLNYYSQETERFYRVKTPKNCDIIKSIIETKKGDIIIGTSGGILKMENNTNQFKILPVQLPDVRIHTILERNGIIYAATYRGIWAITDEKCSRIEEIDKTFFIALALDEYGNIWTGTKRRNKLFKITQNHEVISIKLPKGIRISSICSSRDNKIWISAGLDGLICFDIDKNKILKHIINNPLDDRSLPHNAIKSMLIDISNTLWVGGHNGVAYTNLLAKDIRAIHLQQNMPRLKNYQIRSLLIDDDDLYIGFENQGIYKVSKNDNYKTVKVINDKISASSITKIQDEIYFTNYRGLFKLKNNVFEKEPIKKRDVSSICADPYGNLYCSAFNDLMVKKNNTDKYKSAKELYPHLKTLHNKRFYTIKYDNTLKCIWAGTVSEGLLRLNLKNDGNIKSVEHYNSSLANEYYIQNDAIWCIYISKHTDAVWIGGNAGLLYKGKGSKKFKLIEEKGVLNQNIMSIQIDRKDNLWLGSSRALIHYNPTVDKSRTYTYYDGFQSSAFTEASTSAKDGTIFIGGINGVNYFNPEDVQDNEILPTIMFNKFKIHNQEVAPQKELLGSIVLHKNINLTSKIVLNYKQNNFKLDFSTTNFINAKDVTYRYQMEGYDDEPITVDGEQNFVAYTNLPKGTYTFWVEVSNSDGVWNPDKRKITFKITPPLWQSTLAHVTYTILTISIIIAFIYFSHNRQRLNHQLEINKIQQKKDHEANEMKLSFFTDIAHEFKTPLSLIVGPVNDLLKNNLSKEQKNFFYQVMERNTKRMSFLVNQLLDFRKINAGINVLKISKQDLSAFIHDISQAFLWQTRSKDINFKISAPESFECFFDRDILEKSLYNLLSNAFKFTPKNGSVEIEVTQISRGNTKYASISIKDNGKGITDDDKLKIFERFHHGKTRASSGIGLNLTNNLIQAHKGEILVKDSAIGGTEFTLNIPVNEKSYSQEEFYEEKENNESKIVAFLKNKKEKPIKPKKEEKILLVEDDIELRSYLRNSLNTLYFVVEAENGVEGLSQAEKELPDLIISDVMMPEMDGIEFCKLMKQNSQTSHIPILMLTAKTDEEFRKEGLKAGAWDYITKPFKSDNLLQKIENIIKTRNNHKAYLLEQNLSVLLKENYTPYEKKFITNFTKSVLKNMTIEDFTLDDYANEIGLSRSQLHRKIKQITNQPSTSLINTIKINYATEMFNKGCINVKEAMYATGFNNYVHFNRTFKKFKKTAPKEYIESVKS